MTVVFRQMICGACQKRLPEKEDLRCLAEVHYIGFCISRQNLGELGGSRDEGQGVSKKVQIKIKGEKPTIKISRAKS